MNFNKVLLTALIGALTLGLYFSNNRLNAQTTTCEISVNHLENFIQSANESSQLLAELTGNVDQFHITSKDPKLSMNENLYLIEDARVSAKQANERLEHLNRQIENQLRDCSPYANKKKNFFGLRI